MLGCFWKIRAASPGLKQVLPELLESKTEQQLPIRCSFEPGLTSGLTYSMFLFSVMCYKQCVFFSQFCRDWMQTFLLMPIIQKKKSLSCSFMNTSDIDSETEEGAYLSGLLQRASLAVIY